ncbi:peptide chain release factor 2 [bacterium DOLZORAL124_38_8]|nr:MAG: peptide chain release factor 2 [bacterium DOLZORAL124_38_8]
MEKKDLLQRAASLQAQFKSIESKLDLCTKKDLQKQLKTQTEAPDFWNQPTEAQKISQKLAQTEKYINTWEHFPTEIQELTDLIAISEDSDLDMLDESLHEIETKFTTAETQMLLSGAYDDHAAIISIFTGNGGQDAEDFSQMLYRMYLRWSEQNGFQTKILEESFSDDGLKSATFEVNGALAYGLLKSEHGVHRLIRLSPFNAKNLRQTSFSRIEVIPQIEQETDIQLEDKDLRIDVFRAGGNGGQSVNTTDSAVRITYLPLGLSVSCQNEKSQLQNKQSALKVLKSRLLQLKLEQNAQEINELKGGLIENSFGSQIRTYTLQPYKLVKDHRTNTEHSNPDKVLDGDLQVFIDSFLRQ